MEEKGEDQAKQTTKKDIGKRRRQSKTNDRKKMEEKEEDRAKQDRKNGREGKRSSDKKIKSKIWTRE